MALGVEMHKRGIVLSKLEQRRIDRHIASLSRRVEKFPDPRLELALEEHQSPRRVKVDLRLALGPLGGHLVSHQEGPAADVAVKSAVDDVKRQLERRLASLRGEESYGVPSRRLPDDLRATSAAEEDLRDDELEAEPWLELTEEAEESAHP